MKKYIALLLTVTMILSMSMTVFARTPQYDVDMPEIPEIHVELPDEYKESIDKSVQEHLKDLDIKLLATTEITKATYIHFGLKSRLQIEWNDVDGATSYEIKITKPDGTEHTYTSKEPRLIVKTRNDKFIKGCPKQKIGSKWEAAKVKVRAVKNDGEVYSLWSEEEPIGCNVIHIGELFKGRKKQMGDTDNYDYCYECTGCGDDYYIDDRNARFKNIQED